MKITDLSPQDQNKIQQTAKILVDGFKEFAPEAWPNLAEALEEVQESFGEGRISRVAIDHDENVLGWIGGIRHRKGHVWELHPLVVRRDCQRKGIGRALVNDLEEQVRQRGALVLWLGSDDETSNTSLSGKDLFPNPLERLQNIKNLNHHPYQFYQKLGYEFVGVMPDANGFGKPDIFMAKRISFAKPQRTLCTTRK